MYKLEFTLKQHTPLIHFQHDQAGATLRATEVKPKLDKFIIEKLTGQIGEKAFDLFKANSVWKNWLVGKGEHPALDYRMSIIGQPSVKYVIASRLDEKHCSPIGESFNYIPESPFFAEEKSISALFERPRFKGDPPVLKAEYPELLGNISKQGILNKDHENIGNDIHVKIVSFNSDLRSEIKNNLIHFFLSENFGCRQNKGFGCFTVNEIENEKQSCDDNSLIIKGLFDYVYSKNSSNDFIGALSAIQKDYKLLKAGRGRKEGYAKSKLYLYFAKKNIRWEKRWIKQEYYKTNKTDFPNDLTVDSSRPNTSPIDINLKNDWDDGNHPNNSKIEYQYIRAVLGLAEQFEFQTNSEFKEKFVVQLGSESNPIQRFKSPITFKFIDGCIYLLANKLQASDTSPLGKSVEFTFRMKDKQNKLKDSPKCQIPSPPQIPTLFDIEAFIDFAIKDNSDNAKLEGYTKI